MREKLLIVSVVLLLMLPSMSARAVTIGHMFNQNCFVSVTDALNAYYQSLPFDHIVVGSTIYGVKHFYNRATNLWQRSVYTFNPSTSEYVFLSYKQLTVSNDLAGDYFYECEIPDTPGLVGNSQPSVFSPMYETAKTLVNTQALMIFLWVVATFFLGFKFGYFMINASNGGKHDSF